jgi:hypothetical protein
MPLNSLGQAYATLLFKLLAQLHQKVLRRKKELNVSDSTALHACRSKAWARLTQNSSSNSSQSAISKYCGQKRNYEHLLSQPLRRWHTWTGPGSQHSCSNHASAIAIIVPHISQPFFSLEIKGENLAHRKNCESLCSMSQGNVI